MSEMPVHPEGDPSPSDISSFMTCEQLSGCSGMSMMELGELVSYSALIPTKSYIAQPDAKNNEHWVFSAQWLKPLRAASKLRQDFDLDIFTVAILLGSLQRIEELEQSIQSMQLKMQGMVQVGANSVAELACDDQAQLDLFHKNKWWWN